MICIVALTLSSCSKKSASSRLTRSDADIFFEKPTIQEYKRMPQGGLVAFGASSVDYGVGKGSGFVLADKGDGDGGQALSTQQYKHKLLDIPLPVDSFPIAGCKDYIAAQELSLSRYTSLNQSALLDFYTSMFEQSGWCLMGQVNGACESVMVWAKPRKLCAVSLRSIAKRTALKTCPQTRIVINMCEKKKYK